MTPRSRKPVIIGGMRGLTADTYHPNFIDFQMDDEIGHSFECENTPDRLHTSLHRSKSESSLLCRSPIESHAQQLTSESIRTPSATLIKSTSDETLSTPFRLVVVFLCFVILSLPRRRLFHFLFFYARAISHWLVHLILTIFSPPPSLSLFDLLFSNNVHNLQEIFIQPKFTNDNTC